MSTAAYLRPPPSPPNDPTWLDLDGRIGWQIATPPSAGIEVAPADCALTLKWLSGTGRTLTEPSGSFGGLVTPSNVALDADCELWLLDRKSGKLFRFDRCCCAFVMLPCTAGIGRSPRQLVAPGGITACGPNVLVVDSGKAATPGSAAAPGRVLVFARHALALRAVWQPPKHAVPNPWHPSAVACDSRGRALVADPANGAIHVFDRGGVWREAWMGFGAVAAIAVDCFDRVTTMVPGESDVRISDSSGKEIGRASEIGEVAHCFRRIQIASDPTGRINLSAFCPDGGWFDTNAKPVTAPVLPQPAFPTSGVWVTNALDSKIAHCQWHRIVLDACIPPRTGVAFTTYTSEVEQPIELITALPDAVWTAVPPMAAGATEALILSPPGRYLWLKATLRGRGHETPRLCRVKIEFPRISLRRYLPAAFGSDPVSADFTDRLLAIFDQGFRSVESTIDTEAKFFDPRSAPAVSPVPGKPDMLTWLASWIGVSFDRAWPVERRRQYLRSAAKLFPCRATLRGIRGSLLLFLGLADLCVVSRKPSCGPRCADAPPRWCPPPLILEHWKIRRWLYLGAGRLGDASVLWGETIMGRTELDVTARLGMTKLDVTRDPERDPFHADAYAYTAFVPARYGRSARDRAALDRALQSDTPAYVKANLRFVHPRMRIGIQSSIGFDSVVGCWPEGVVLGSAELGRATVLGPGDPVDPAPRIGATTRLRPANVPDRVPHSKRSRR